MTPNTPQFFQVSWLVKENILQLGEPTSAREKLDLNSCSTFSLTIIVDVMRPRVKYEQRIYTQSCDNSSDICKTSAAILKP